MDSRLVFISYARKDGKPFAAELEKRIEETTNLRAFFDLSDLQTGDAWQLKINKAIEDSFAVIVVVSQAANTSVWVTYEWAYASGKGKRILPLIIDTDAEPDIHSGLKADWQFDNRFVSPTEDDWQQLLDMLEQIQSELEVPSSVQKAKEAAEDFEIEKRKSAVDYLEHFEHPSAVDALIELCDSFLPDTKMRAAIALARIDKVLPVTFPGLEIALSDFILRDEARNYLTKVNTDEAASALYRAYNNRKVGQKNEIIQSLLLMDANNVTLHLKEIWKTPGQSRHIGILIRLEEAGDKSVLPDVEARLYSQNLGGITIEYLADVALGLINYELEDVIPIANSAMRAHFLGRYTINQVVFQNILKVLRELGNQTTIGLLINFKAEYHTMFEREIDQCIQAIRQRLDAESGDTA